jgi:Protein of unknown function (DUF3631)
VTAVLEQPADLTGLTWDELDAVMASADGDETVISAVVAESDRRERAERIAGYRVKVQQRAAARRAEWESGAYAQYMAAEAAHSGNLLSRAGKAAGINPWPRLWTGSEDRARVLASEELCGMWNSWPRVTVTQYTQQVSEAARIQRDERERERMDTTEQAARPMPDLAAKAAARKQEIARIREDRGLPPRAAAETVAVRPAAPVAGAPPQIDGAALLGYVRAFVTKYTYLTPAQADAVTLWIGHTHARDEEGYLAARCSPRLYALSSKPGSGKSTLLEHCGRLCPATFGLDTEPSEAGLVYSISKEHATILLDEADVLFGSGKRKQAVRAVINAGYMPNGTVLKVRGGKGERVRIYGALALAGLDVMEKATNGVLDALLTRGVIIRMKQAPEGHELPEMSRTDESNAAKLKMVLEKWGTAGRDDMAGLEVDVPDGIRNRQAQIWKTLLRVGKYAGGDWYDRAYAACEALALAGADDDADRTAEIMDELAGVFGGWDTEGELA